MTDNGLLLAGTGSGGQTVSLRGISPARARWLSAAAQAVVEGTIPALPRSRRAPPVLQVLGDIDAVGAVTTGTRSTVVVDGTVTGVGGITVGTSADLEVVTAFPAPAR